MRKPSCHKYPVVVATTSGPPKLMRQELENNSPPLQGECETNRPIQRLIQDQSFPSDSVDIDL